MDKFTLIQTLTDMPVEFFKTAYVITAWDDKSISIQMKYNKALVKQLINGNKWTYKIDPNGLVEFKRDDGLEVIMT